MGCVLVNGDVDPKLLCVSFGICLNLAMFLFTNTLGFDVMTILTITSDIRAEVLEFETHLPWVKGEIVALPVNGSVDPMFSCISWHVFKSRDVFAY